MGRKFQRNIKVNMEKYMDLKMLKVLPLPLLNQKRLRFIKFNYEVFNYKVVNKTYI